jgi:hypothetical protein
LDAARWNDNFAAVVLKITDRGKEIVYCDAWERTEFSESAKRIREIVRRFNVSYITMDTGGGGVSTQEWLCKKVDDVDPEDFIWVIPDQIEKYTDSKSNMSAPGKKILEMVDFTPAWISRAAHGVESDIEQCNILFPYKVLEENLYQQYMRHFSVDSVSERIKIQLQSDAWGLDDWEAERMSTESGSKIEPKMGVMQNVDECINETCAIARVVSPKGTESFELPKLSEQPEGLDMRRRDRWSALMLANYAAKVYMGTGHRIKSGSGRAAGNTRSRSYTSRGLRRRGSAVW